MALINGSNFDDRIVPSGAGYTKDGVFVPLAANTSTSGIDTLIGGTGSDTLIGGEGNDTAVFAAGTGSDTVNEVLNGGTDTVKVTGLGPDQVRLITDVSGSGNLFLISKLDPLDNMTIAASTTGAGTAAETQVGEYVERIVFDDLTVWDLTGALTLEGSSANETIYGSAFGDTILGLDGADQLYGNRGDDTLDGGTGSDTLIGGDGNDTLTGGAGDDTLNGGVGNDTYQVNRGDGQDTISESDSTLGNSDTLLYGATINPLDLVLSREANDLRLAIHGSPERVTIQNWFSTPGTAQVETIQAGNGQTLLNTQVDQLIEAMAGFTSQTGLTWDQAIDQQPQNVQAVLAASWQ